MRFPLDDEQEQLRKVLRAFLDSESAEARVRSLMATPGGVDTKMWARLGSDLEVLGLAVPEKFGGSGGTFREVGIVIEELGRVLACVPYFSSVVLAQSALLSAGDDRAAQRWLPGLASGATRGTVALAESPLAGDEAAITTTATPHGTCWRLTGTESYVVDGCTADLVLAVARTEAGPTLFAIESDAPGMRRTELPPMDLTRKLARIELLGTPAKPIGIPGAGHATMSRVLDLATVGLAAEQVGGAGRVLEMAVDYAKVRKQFGRPIGSFQAVKHKCADLLVEVELSRSLAYHGLIAASESPEDLPIAAPLAGAHCSQTYYHAAAANIQVHGGIGFTWEHPAHLYFKRAKSSELLLGGAARHRARLANRLGIGPGAGSATSECRSLKTPSDIGSGIGP